MLLRRSFIFPYLQSSLQYSTDIRDGLVDGAKSLLTSIKFATSAAKFGMSGVGEERKVWYEYKAIFYSTSIDRNGGDQCAAVRDTLFSTW